jgi:membrane fusion protein (multidrug efflux system)
MKRIFMFISMCALVGFTSCHSEIEEHNEEETEFLVTSPIRMDTSITEEYVSQIHSSQHIELRALERGYLQSIYVDEGQFVKKGQLMFQIMPRIYQAELHRAQAEAEFAEIEYKNTKSLADSDVVAPNELAMARAKYNKAQAELQLAETHLGFTEIRAPFDGFMNRFHVRSGSLLDEGELLSTLSDNSKMWVYFNVPEAEYLDYMSQAKRDSLMKVQLQMANGKIFPHQGVVETIEADFNHETGNISFRATFPNPTGLLRHGETGNVLVSVPLENALLIPQKATFEVLDKRYVFVITDENVVKAQEIEISAEMPHLYAVTSGLEEDDKILLEGLRLVKRGDEIHTKFLDPAKAISELDLYAE